MSKPKHDVRPLLTYFVVSIVCAALIWLLWPVIPDGHYAGMKSACLSQLKQLGKGFWAYAADYDETAMLAEGWTSSLLPYVKNPNVFRCPKAREESGDSSWGYAYNWIVPEAKLPSVKNPVRTILFFEASSLGRNTCGGKSAVAKPGRHAGVNGFTFLDGHARMVRDGDDPGSWTLSPTR